MEAFQIHLGLHVGFHLGLMFWHFFCDFRCWMENQCYLIFWKCEYDTNLINAVFLVANIHTLTTKKKGNLEKLQFLKITKKLSFLDKISRSLKNNKKLENMNIVHKCVINKDFFFQFCEIKKWWFFFKKPKFSWNHMNNKRPPKFSQKKKSGHNAKLSPKKTTLNHRNMQNIEHIMGMIWFAILKGFLQPKKKIVIILNFHNF